MSEIFSNYEEEYCKLENQITKKIYNISNQTNGFFLSPLSLNNPI